MSSSASAERPRVPCSTRAGNGDLGSAASEPRFSLTVGPEASFPSHSASFAAPGGGEHHVPRRFVRSGPGAVGRRGHHDRGFRPCGLVNVKLRAKPRATSSSSHVLIQGSSVAPGDTVKIKSSAGSTSQAIDIGATSGHVVIERLSLNTNLDEDHHRRPREHLEGSEGCADDRDHRRPGVHVRSHGDGGSGCDTRDEL